MAMSDSEFEQAKARLVALRESGGRETPSGVLGKLNSAVGRNGNDGERPETMSPALAAWATVIDPHLSVAMARSEEWAEMLLESVDTDDGLDAEARRGRRALAVADAVLRRGVDFVGNAALASAWERWLASDATPDDVRAVSTHGAEGPVEVGLLAAMRWLLLARQALPHPLATAEEEAWDWSQVAERAARALECRASARATYLIHKDNREFVDLKESARFIDDCGTSAWKDCDILMQYGLAVDASRAPVEGSEMEIDPPGGGAGLTP